MTNGSEVPLLGNRAKGCWGEVPRAQLALLQVACRDSRTRPAGSQGPPAITLRPAGRAVLGPSAQGRPGLQGPSTCRRQSHQPGGKKIRPPLCQGCPAQCKSGLLPADPTTAGRLALYASGALVRVWLPGPASAPGWPHGHSVSAPVAQRHTVCATRESLCPGPRPRRQLGGRPAVPKAPRPEVTGGAGGSFTQPSPSTLELRTPVELGAPHTCGRRNRLALREGGAHTEHSRSVAAHEMRPGRRRLPCQPSATPGRRGAPGPASLRHTCHRQARPPRSVDAPQHFHSGRQTQPLKFWVWTHSTVPVHTVREPLQDTSLRGANPPGHW